MPIYDHVKVFFDAVRLHHAVKHRGAALEILNMLFIRFYALAVEYCGTDYIILTSHFCLDLEMDGESKLFFTKIYTTVVCTCTYICWLLLVQTRMRVYHKITVLEHTLQKMHIYMT